MDPVWIERRLRDAPRMISHLVPTLRSSTWLFNVPIRTAERSQNRWRWGQRAALIRTGSDDGKIKTAHLVFLHRLNVISKDERCRRLLWFCSVSAALFEMKTSPAAGLLSSLMESEEERNVWAKGWRSDLMIWCRNNMMMLIDNFLINYFCVRIGCIFQLLLAILST